MHIYDILRTSSICQKSRLSGPPRRPRSQHSDRRGCFHLPLTPVQHTRLRHTPSSTRRPSAAMCAAVGTLPVPVLGRASSRRQAVDTRSSPRPLRCPCSSHLCPQQQPRARWLSSQRHHLVAAPALQQDSTGADSAGTEIAAMSWVNSTSTYQIAWDPGCPLRLRTWIAAFLLRKSCQPHASVVLAAAAVSTTLTLRSRCRRPI